MSNPSIENPSLTENSDEQIRPRPNKKEKKRSSDDEDSDDDEKEVELSGCGATLFCDPRRWLHRYLVLIPMCLLSFGSYFCYDNPAAMQDVMIKDLKIDKTTFMGFYSWYSWPNVILCFFGGYLIDRVFGIRWGTIIFSGFVCVGQVIFALGAFFNMIWLMDAGRFVFGIGGESLAVAQNTYAVSWFKGSALNMVFGLQLSFARIGSTVNMNVMLPLYNLFGDDFNVSGYKQLGLALGFGAFTCLFSLGCGIIIGLFDKRAKRILGEKAAGSGEVISFKDIRDFGVPLWLICIICVAYYVTVFPFIGLGLVFFESKYDFLPADARIINSLVFVISAVASPVCGFLVDRTGRNVMWCAVAILLTTASHALFAFSFLNPYIGMSILGISYSLLASALWPMVAYVVEEHQLGTAYGIMQSIQNLGLAVISLLTGIIVDSKGYLILEIFFLIWLFVALICTALLYLYNEAKGGDLNLSAAGHKRRYEEKLLNEGRQPLPSSSQSESSPLLTPQTSFAIRNRFLSRIGAELPEHLSAQSHGLAHRARPTT